MHHGKGFHRVELQDAKGRPMSATLEMRYQNMTVLPPIGKRRHYPGVAANSSSRTGARAGRGCPY